MRHCIDQTRQWPDTSADVSSDEMDDFLAHAEVCLYHAELIETSFEQELRSIFRLARGFDEKGRVLHGAELDSAIAEHERRIERWETIGSAESPFRFISLYNGGRLIAGSGEFRNYTYQQSLHDLDPRAGLQIRVRCDGNTNEEVLLGFYALRGVRHDGKEMLLPLNNDYTVGIKVRQLGERSYEVRFRCFEECLSEEEDADAGSSIGRARAAGNAPGRSTSPWSDVLLPQTPQFAGWQLAIGAGGGVLLSLCLIACCLASGLLGFKSSATVNAATLLAEDGKQPQTTPTPSHPRATPTATPFETPPSTPRGWVVSSDWKLKLKKGLATLKNAANPIISPPESWTIISTCRQGGTDIKIKHFGDDPELEGPVRKVLNEQNNPCKVVQSAKFYTHGTGYKLNYETFWRRAHLVEGDVAQSKIVMEVRTPSVDNNDLLRQQYPVLLSPMGHNYEAAILSAFVDIYHYLRLPQGDFARGITFNSTSAQAPFEPQSDGDDGLCKHCDNVEAPQKGPLAEIIEDR